MKSLKWLLAGFMFLSSTFSFAQNANDAKASFQEFMTLSGSATSKEKLFKSLEQCYVIALKCSKSLSGPDLNDVKSILVTIWPSLQNAAVYYDQNGDKSKALFYSNAFVDVALMNIFQNEYFSKSGTYSQLVAYSASGSYNKQDYFSAIKYSTEYLSLKVPERRQDMFRCLAQSYIQNKDYSKALSILEKGTREFPADYNMLATAINVCIDIHDNSTIEQFLNKALQLKPHDVTLLSIQGKVYEETFRFQKAVHIYSQLNDLKPGNLEITKHLAFSNFNAGAYFTNQSMTCTEKTLTSRYVAQATDYFKGAIPVLKKLIANEPHSSTYLEALAIASLQAGDAKNFEYANSRLASIGHNMVSSSSTPSYVDISGRHSTFSDNNQSVPSGRNDATMSGAAIPPFSEFAKDYITSEISRWQAKDPYETINEYKMRVNDNTRNTKVAELTKTAEDVYLRRFTEKLRISDFRLCPYDAEHEVFLAESKYGDVIIPVPRFNNEARMFEMSWSGIQLEAPEFCLNGDKIAIKSLRFRTPEGKSYLYDNTAAVNYTVATVQMNFSDIDYSKLSNERNFRQIHRDEVLVGNSDVDSNIPVAAYKRKNTFALIIGNEDYDIVADVPMANNDCSSFSKYCELTLGIPKDNIRMFNNASYGTMLRSLREMDDIANAVNSDFNLIFYYAGHGIPNEKTKDAYLLPVDADGLQTEVCLPLSTLYERLGRLKANSVFVFLDACFSGSQRNGTMLLSSARSVAIKYNPSKPKGNMVVISAASGSETALPYNEKGHGMFTYFLLKKLQESKGEVTIKELYDYVSGNVRSQSVLVNHKLQTPSIMVSDNLLDNYQSLKLK